jgi:hypothetical protein
MIRCCRLISCKYNEQYIIFFKFNKLTAFIVIYDKSKASLYRLVVNCVKKKFPKKCGSVSTEHKTQCNLVPFFQAS